MCTYIATVTSIHTPIDHHARTQSGGLGFGGAFGAPKKKEDGLPNNGASVRPSDCSKLSNLGHRCWDHPTRTKVNPSVIRVDTGLYAFFVRPGEGGYKRWDDNEAEAEPEQGSEEEPAKKKSRSKKEKKEKKKRKAEAAAAAEAEEEAAAAAVVQKPAAKRKRAESVDHNPQEAGEDAGAAGVPAGAAAFPWEKHIKKALKGAEGQAMCIKKLRKHVVGLARAHPAMGQQKKKQLKRAFHGAVEAHGKLRVDEAAGVVAYQGKNKDKGENKKQKRESGEGKGKAKAKAAAVAEPVVAAVEEAAVSAKRSKKDKKKEKKEKS